MTIGTAFDISSYFDARRREIEVALDRHLPPVTACPETLHESLRYSVLAPGKRLRPILVLAGAEAVGGVRADVMATACAFECIHAFSLIHDDLPCMDNDDYRRGRLTNHKVYGDDIALLAGDALLTLAFELIADNVATSSPERVLPVVRLAAHATGTWGMVGGQVVDMQSQGQDVTPDTLRYIHSHKTGVLITASLLAGAMLAGASDVQIQSLETYGEHIGLAFQIADDILDIVGDQSKIGKPVGSDEERNKATYPRLFGLEESRRRAHAEVEGAIQSLAGFDSSADPLRGIARYIVERDL